MLFPNEGWETGDFDEWVETNVYSSIQGTIKRTGSYALEQQSGPAGGEIVTQVTYTITDAAILALLAGVDVTFKSWVYCDQTIGGSVGSSDYYIEVSDQIGNNQTDLYPITATTWTQFSVTRTITGTPTFIRFKIYFLKASGATKYKFYHDDMESVPIDVIPHLTVEIASNDVTDKILAVHTERGWDSELAQASAGICELTCDNFAGDFSPEKVAGAYYPDLRIGAFVEVYETYLGTRYDLFKGRIENIDPKAEMPSAYAYISALDGMDDMAQRDINTVLRTNTETGELADDILDAMNWPGGDRDVDTGADVLQLGWFHKIKGLEAIRLLEAVENGRFYIGPTGIAVWENRYRRLAGAGLVSQYDFGERVAELGYEFSKRLVRNEITVRGSRYFIGGVTLWSGYDMATLDDELMWSAHAGDSGAPYIPQASTLILWAEFNTPIESYTSLVKGTHWDANTLADKTGVDVGANITLTQTQYGQSIKLQIANAGSVGAYLVVPDSPPVGAPTARTLLIYGTLYGIEEMSVFEEDATSRTAYGARSLTIDARFKSNPNDLKSYAEYMKAKYKDAVPRAVLAKFNHRQDWPDDSILIQCLTREISDRITLASTRLGFDRDFYINKVVHDYLLNEGVFVASTTFYVERASGTAEDVYWILGEAGFSEVGETTFLGF